MTTTIESVLPRTSELRSALFDLGRTREDLSRARERITSLERDKVTLEARVARLERDNADLRRQLYAPSSERRRPPASASEEGARSPPPLPAVAPPPAPPSNVANPKPAPRRAAPHGRAPLATALPHRDVNLELDESKRRCPDCGEDCRPFDTESSEVLELVPSAFEVVRYRRQRWSCPACQSQVFRPDLPVPIPRARASARVLAYVATSKFADHLPHYRIEGILARQGVEVSRSTLGDWNRGTVKLLKHVVDAIEQDVLASPVVGTDETILAVRDKTAAKNIREGRLWLYRGARGDCLMKYTPDKGAKWPASVLKDYSGIVQADAANTFDRLFKDGMRIEAGCNAHARRKVVKVEDLPEAGPLLEKYRALYEIEAEAKERGLTPEERLRLRQERSRPIMDELYGLFRALHPPSGTPLAAAVGYALNHETALRRFLDDGRLEIDNNNVERLFRLVALGRRNWFFAGSRRGAENAAVVYSIVASCRDLGIDPFLYLSEVLMQIPTTTASRIRELTPRRWHEARLRSK
jgi:transposase